MRGNRGITVQAMSTSSTLTYTQQQHRKRIQRVEKVTVWMPPAWREELEQLCTESDRSMADVLRESIQDFLEWHGRPVEPYASSARVRRTVKYKDRLRQWRRRQAGHVDGRRATATKKRRESMSSISYDSSTGYVHELLEDGPIELGVFTDGVYKQLSSRRSEQYVRDALGSELS